MKMRSANTTMTIAEYYEQLVNKQIVVNHNYQRTDKVWPTSAKSNLIDTILSGYPLPKLILSQTTDLDTLKTRKEVVDGQQRTAAIVEFFDNKYAITRGPFTGARFEDLDDQTKVDFISYVLAIDLFPTASDEDIREIFRRINSYQVPLNKQETRHAVYQGEFKAFIAETGRVYGGSLLKMGVFTEKQLSRMNDLEFITELVAMLKDGIKTSSPSALTKVYDGYDKVFLERDEFEPMLKYGLDALIALPEIHGGVLASRSSFYSLFGAFVAVGYPNSKPSNSIEVVADPAAFAPRETIVANLGLLADAIENDDTGGFAAFVSASKQGTNTLNNRTTRLNWYYRALTEALA